MHITHHMLEKVRRICLLASIILIAARGITASAMDVTVWPDKMYVKPGETVRLAVTVRGVDTAKPAKVESRVIRGLGAEAARFEGTTDARGQVVFEFKPQKEFGYEVWATASVDGQCAYGQEFFACAANPFATAVDYGNVFIYAQLDLMPDKTPALRGEPQNPDIIKNIETRTAECRNFYHSVVESGTTYGNFYPGAPPTDNFFQGSYVFGSVNGWRKSFEALRTNGIRSMVYGGAFLIGTGGSDFARKYPDLLSYGEDGWLSSGIDTENTRIFRDFSKNYPESLKTVKMEWWNGILGVPPDLQFGRPNFVDPIATEIGTKCIIDAYEAFGFDGVRFDGHYSVPCMGDPLAVATKLTDWQGVPQPTGADGDRLTGRNMRYCLSTVNKKYPEFIWGFNFASFRPDGWGYANLDREEIKAIAPGNWILDECAKGALSPSHPDNKWSGFIKNLGGEADRIRQHDAHLFAGWGGGPGQKDFDTRLVKAVSWALGFRWRVGGEFKQSLNPVTYRRDNQFAYRYSQYLLANARTRLSADEAGKLVAAGASRPVWFKDFVYRSTASGERCIVVNLINAPLEDHLTVDAAAPPLAKNLRLELNETIFEGGKPSTGRIMVLSPDLTPYAQAVTTARVEGGWLKMTLPPLPLWCIVVVPY